LKAAALLFCVSALAAPAAVATIRAAVTIEGQAVQGGLVRGQMPPGVTSVMLDDRPVTLAPDGRFILGFDRDQGRRAMLHLRFADGGAAEQVIAVAPRSWPIEHVNVARRPAAVPDEIYRRRRAGELERIASARAIRSAATGWSQRFIWPASGRISGRFGSQRVYRGEPAAYHSGVDVAAGAGAPVVAPADGLVVLAGPPMFSLEGNLVILDHGQGLNSAFLHLSRVDVAAGQRVRQGERIGAVGATGRATGPHLHWSMMWNGARLDPQLLAPQG
jgi:murein DD-endopeptidase MepM/ murein hydrolase activator NlpD